MAPVITSEKSQYWPEETVLITGSNFGVYEKVTVEISYNDPYLQQQVLVNRFEVFADGEGRINTSWEVPAIDQTEFTIEATGTLFGKTAKTAVSTAPLVGESVTITQCANSNASPQNLSCPSGGNTGWVTGNVGSSKARYFEGNSLPYRGVLQGLEVGDTYKWTIQYDTSKGGINTIDYLTTYNRTITNANPCQNGANANGFCTAGAPDSTFAIPTDPNVTNGRDQTNGTSDDITQIAGNISAWGATITGVSVPTYTGTFPGGDSTASVDITFTANSATAVIAWAGHISTRTDWGQAFGSVNRTGSPYHTNNGGLMNVTDSTNCCTGSQDLQLMATAVTPTAKIIIKKNAAPPTSMQQFNFTTTNLTPSMFSLTDDQAGSDPMQVFDGISTFNMKTITETSMGSYSLQSIDCTVDIGTGGTPTPVRSGNSIMIDIKSGDQVTCTFRNAILTAAAVSVSGRVFDTRDRGLSRAIVRLTGIDGTVRMARTNPFGYFRFEDVEAGQTYVIEAYHKLYRFTPQTINLDENAVKLTLRPNHK